MNVRDLKKALEKYDDDMEVHIAFNSGDYWRTILAPSVRSLDQEYIKYSDYHQKPKLCDFDEEKIEDEDLVLVIKG